MGTHRFGPDGRSLAEPLAPTEEGLLFADIDFAGILAAKNAADPVGHYPRPDVFTLRIENNGRLPKVATTLTATTDRATSAEITPEPVPVDQP